MRTDLWTGLTRGLLLGLLGGLAAGAVEAGSIVRDAPAGRSALVEAGLYAVIVDALGSAIVAAIAGALLALILRLSGRQIRDRDASALYIAGATALVLILVGLLWAFKANGADRSVGVPLAAATPIVVLAVAFGGLVYPLARPFAGAALGRARVVAAAGIVGAMCLGLVFPVQVVVEARASQTSNTTALQAVDPGVVESDMRADLETRLAQVGAGAGAGDVARRPNIVLITLDATRADHMGFCGNPWIQTPTLDLLASYSAISCSMYTQQPQTNPALAALFTSTYPSVNGVRVHMVDRLADSWDTLARELQRNGYETAGLIPWTSLEPAFSGLQSGFRTYDAVVVNEPTALQNPTTAALAGIYRRVTQQVALGGAVESVLGMRQGTEAEIDGRADVTASAAINWMANNKTAPFFFWVHYFDPHYPFTPPEPWDQIYPGGRAYDGPFDGAMGFVYEMRAGIFNPTPRDVEFLRSQYASEITYADHYIGQMLGFMARQNLLDNTIIVVTADHGEELGERGTPDNWLDGTYWLHGDDLHEPGIRVPLIIFDPRSTNGHQE
ncbi:MAG: hypothetical protein QOF51_2412, partial [Chloroflexota bacterium]|nr:hypothetical protein [Chloroflexota bacterium]